MAALRVLLAEDDCDLRELLADTLRRAGYQVIEANNGAELLSHVHQERGKPSMLDVDAIVSDMRMPGMTGLEALDFLRSGESSVPFILMTGFGSPELKAEARKLGATAVLSKPFLPGDLRLMLGLLLGRRRGA